VPSGLAARLTIEGPLSLTQPFQELRMFFPISRMGGSGTSGGGGFRRKGDMPHGLPAWNRTR